MNKPRRILVADDNDASRNALRRHLIDAGYNVCTTTSGADVVLLCDVDPPDVLIVDLHLPDMDGFEVCERVRHDLADDELTVIVTADASDELTHSYLGQMVDYAGGDFFLAKPCDVNMILTVLEDLAMTRRAVSQRRGAAFPTRVTWPTTTRRR